MEEMIMMEGSEIITLDTKIITKTVIIRIIKLVSTETLTMKITMVIKIITTIMISQKVRLRKIIKVIIQTVIIKRNWVSSTQKKKTIESN